MCGIAGIVDFAGRPIDADALRRACATMRHRGPDDDGIWTGASGGMTIGLASTRLAVIDPTPAGHQPMVAPDGSAVVAFNGIIYNHRDLRRELLAAGAVMTTHCDTEVVLAACSRWGADALKRLDGMWALAYFDLRNGAGFLSRDRFGIKPLVWARCDDRLAFASEMRTLRGLFDWPRSINPDALKHYVRYGFVAHPDTIYEHAHRLPPSTSLTLQRGQSAGPVEYDQLPTAAAGHDIDLVAAARDLRRTIFESVARHRVADVPIGAFLSGGLDSSIIVAHLAELSADPIPTFSVGWDEHRTYDESPFARDIARRFRTDHHAVRCKYADVIDLLPRMLDHLGEPFFDSSILPAAIVSRFARRQVTVCLSGDGGDELFGGYWRYKAHGFLDRYRRIPRALRAGIIEPMAARASGSKSTRLGNRVRQFRKLLRAAGGDSLARHVAWSRILAPQARDLIRAADDDDPAIERLHSTTASMNPADPLNRIFAFDLRNSLPNDMLHKVDLASMHESLEVRVPFLDPRVVATAMSLPSSLKVDGSRSKIILKQAYRDVLPDSIVDRPKMGFEAPIGEFFRTGLRDMFRDTVTRDVVESFAAPGHASVAPLLDFAAVERLHADHCARRDDHADVLFALLSLCWWRRQDA